MRYNLGVTIAAAGTRVAFNSTRNMAAWVAVQAYPANAGLSYVGGSDVSSTVYDVVLSPGQGFVYPAVADINGYDLQTFFADAANSNDKIRVTYFRR